MPQRLKKGDIVTQEQCAFEGGEVQKLTPQREKDGTTAVKVQPARVDSCGGSIKFVVDKRWTNTPAASKWVPQTDLRVVVQDKIVEMEATHYSKHFDELGCESNHVGSRPSKRLRTILGHSGEGLARALTFHSVCARTD